MNTHQLIDKLHEGELGEIAQFLMPYSDNVLEVTFAVESDEEQSGDGAISDTLNGLTPKGLMIVALAVLELDSTDGTNGDAQDLLNQAIDSVE